MHCWATLMYHGENEGHDSGDTFVLWWTGFLPLFNPLPYKRTPLCLAASGMGDTGWLPRLLLPCLLNRTILSAEFDMRFGAR